MKTNYIHYIIVIDSMELYSKILISKIINLDYNLVSTNIQDIFSTYLKHNIEGICINEGYVQPDSCKVISFTAGTIVRGNLVLFSVTFECNVCLPTIGMEIKCNVVSNVKSGIRAEIKNKDISPVVIFAAKEHHYANAQMAAQDKFANLHEGDEIIVRVNGIRFELNDKFISVIGEIV